VGGGVLRINKKTGERSENIRRKKRGKKERGAV